MTVGKEQKPPFPAPPGVLRWTSRALFCASLSLLAYCTFVLLDARAFQATDNELLDRLVHESQLRASLASSPESHTFQTRAIAPGLIGRIEIPRLGLSEAVVEGSDAKVLRRAVGHVPGTPLPGGQGNAVVTGHRDRYFRPLRNIREGDLIRFIAPAGTYLYRVASIGVVNPGDVELLDSAGGQVLTLITCYPFHFVGAAPHRFVVRAELVANADGLP